jgi:hypothetical protein
MQKMAQREHLKQDKHIHENQTIVNRGDGLETR